MVVLVGFASEHGSTQGVAARLGERLAQHGLAVDVEAMTDVTEVTDYEAVVLGSAIHGSKWLPAAARFVEAHATALAQRPVWLFSVSTLGDDESMFSPLVAARLRAMRKETTEIAVLRETLHAREHRNFAGAIARSHWPATGRAFFRAMGGHYGDHRNWPAIDTWADGIAAALVAPTLGGRGDAP